MRVGPPAARLGSPSLSPSWLRTSGEPSERVGALRRPPHVLDNPLRLMHQRDCARCSSRWRKKFTGFMNSGSFTAPLEGNLVAMNIVVTSLTLVAATGSTHRAPHGAKQLHDDGFAHLRERSLVEARELLRQAESLHPSAPHTQLLRGHCAMADRNLDAALDAYEQADQSTFKLRTTASDEQACTASADVHHAFGRLFRNQERWAEADVRYEAARKLLPSSMALEEEGLFARGKRLLVDDAPAEAAVAFERGLALSSAPWRPHFALQCAHAHGLCGDLDAALEHYEAALRLHALPSRSQLPSLLSTLAVHHEKLHNLDAASRFLRAACDMWCASVGDEPPPSRTAAGSEPHASEVRAATAMTHIKVARALEGLYALTGTSSSTANLTNLTNLTTLRALDEIVEVEDELPPGLETAAAHYRKAIELHPRLAAAYDGLATLLLGTSRLANFGAPSAAALNTDEALSLLQTAASLAASEQPARATAGAAAAAIPSTATKERAAADEQRRLHLDAIFSTRSEVENWREIVANLTLKGAAAQRHTPARPHASANARPSRGAWQVPEALKQVRVVARRRVATAPELMALIKARAPVVLTNLQRDAGFASGDAWSARQLAALAGERIVKVSISQSGRFDGSEDGSLWGLSEGQDVLVRTTQTHLAADYHCLPLLTTAYHCLPLLMTTDDH